MIYVLWLGLDSDPCRGGGGGVTAPSMILYCIYIVFFSLLLYTMSGLDDA